MGRVERYEYERDVFGGYVVQAEALRERVDPLRGGKDSNIFVSSPRLYIGISVLLSETGNRRS